MSARGRSLARSVAGVAVLVLLLRTVGTGPFVAGLRAVDAGSVVTACVITLATTTLAAWRWRVVARGLGMELSLPAAVRAYYRSQFLNTVLPGGVLGDVHRAVRHGRDTGELARSARAVTWERLAGQVVQAALTVVVLLALPSPARAALPFVAAALAVVAFVVVGALLVARGRHGRPHTIARALDTLGADATSAVLRPRAAAAIGAASTGVVAGHVTIFVIAAQLADRTAPVTTVLPLAFVVLLAAAVPLNVAGWGPREGIAAWAFAAAGLGGAAGVAVATVFGVLTVAACLPGALVLALDRAGLRRGRVAEPRACRSIVSVGGPS